jgi:hypothetical protein
MYMSFKLWDEFKPCASATIQDCFHALPQNGEITHTWTYLNVVHTWTYLNVVSWDLEEVFVNPIQYD